MGSVGSIFKTNSKRNGPIDVWQDVFPPSSKRQRLDEDGALSSKQDAAAFTSDAQDSVFQALLSSGSPNDEFPLPQRAPARSSSATLFESMFGSRNTKQSTVEMERKFRQEKRQRENSSQSVQGASSTVASLSSTSSNATTPTFKNSMAFTSQEMQALTLPPTANERTSSVGLLRSLFASSTGTQVQDEHPVGPYQQQPNGVQLFQQDKSQTSDKVLVREMDVKFGRGGGANNHPGNQRYLEERNRLQPRYFAAMLDHEKTKISIELIDFVYKAGGRFLEKKNGEWCVVDRHKARKKACTALRQKHTTPKDYQEKRKKYSKK